MSSTNLSPSPLFIIVGRNEPLYEAELFTNKDTLNASIPNSNALMSSSMHNPNNPLSSTSDHPNDTNNTNNPNITPLTTTNNTTITNNNNNNTSDTALRQNYFVLHSSLDLVDRNIWTTNQMYLKIVDKVNSQMVSVFVTATGIKFMLLHTVIYPNTSKNSGVNNSNLAMGGSSNSDMGVSNSGNVSMHGGSGGGSGKMLSEESIRNFFVEVYDFYVKLSMNPFYQFDTHITSKAFDSRVRLSARRYLTM